MKTKGTVGSIAAFLQLLLFLGMGAAADVSPGDVVDKTNWQKVEGLVPESVLNWVKKGDFVMQMGELNYDPNQYQLEATVRSLERNKGKYGLDEKGLIVEETTGRTPEHIEGIPFPEVDLDDPKAACRLMYNRMCFAYTLGNNYYPMIAIWVGRGGYEREVQMVFQTYPMIGYPPAGKEDNSDLIEKFSIVEALAPFDIKGTNILTWRYLDDKHDMTYAFVPAIRRVRRMSPANRSDAYLGTDMCVDDGYGYDGKISAVDWMPVKKRPAVVPFLDANPQPLVRNKKGEWLTTSTIKDILYGHEAKEWQGAPWAPTNVIWVKRDVLVLEFKPTDPYYNYGTQYLWVDAVVPYLVYYKVITDRANAYWKTIVLCLSGFHTPDKRVRLLQGQMYCTVDDRYQHATILSGLTPDLIGVYNAIQDRNIYSLAGFQRLCK